MSSEPTKDNKPKRGQPCPCGSARCSTICSTRSCCCTVGCVWLRCQARLALRVLLGLLVRRRDDHSRQGENLDVRRRAAGLDRIVVSDHVAYGENLEAYGDPKNGGSAGGKASGASVSGAARAGRKGLGMDSTELGRLS